MSEVVKFDPLGHIKSWLSEAPRDANKLRGKGYNDLAVALVARFPIGSTISHAEFDAFLEENGVLTAPKPVGEQVKIDKQADAWKAHMQRRHEVLTGLYKASTHPRMQEGSTPFVLKPTKGAYLMQAPLPTLAQGSIASDIEKLIGTKKKQLRYLRESLDYGQLSPVTQMQIKLLDRNLRFFEHHLQTDVAMLNETFNDIREQISKEVKSGTITPVNHGIAGLLEDKD